MAVVLDIASRQYTPRTIEQSRNIPAAVKRLRFAFSRESWPAGPCGSLEIFYPNGDPGPSITFDGGDLWTDQFGKRISPVRIPGVLDILTTESYVDFGWQNPETGVIDLPSGLYLFRATILQTLTTRVLVERF